MDKPKLKPCPFCGGEARIARFRTYIESFMGMGYKFYVYCPDCGIDGPGVYLAESDAAAVWNRRADNQLSVGDKVYQTNGFNTYESTVKHVLYDTEKITFDADAIGQSVFLTREEAEKRTMHLALEEAENHEAENHDEKS